LAAIQATLQTASSPTTSVEDTQFVDITDNKDTEEIDTNDKH
jgi:hypothetical protein